MRLREKRRKEKAEKNAAVAKEKEKQLANAEATREADEGSMCMKIMPADRCVLL